MKFIFIDFFCLSKRYNINNLKAWALDTNSEEREYAGCLPGKTGHSNGIYEACVFVKPSNSFESLI